MRKYFTAGCILPLLLCCVVSPVCTGNGAIGKSPYDLLLSVEKWKVSLHLVYDDKRSDGSTEHAVSDWTGTLDIPEVDIGHWYNRGGLDVEVDGVAEINAGKCHTTIIAKGSEKYGFGLNVHKDGYVISQGYCNTQFGTSTMRCPTEVKTSKGSITYSQPWKIKVPLPEQGTTLSGSKTFTHDNPSAADRPLSPGETIMVKWQLTPVNQRDLIYRETALDVAAMAYPGKSVDPHIFINQFGGGNSWIPHANFAGEVWVDGVNKVNIRTGPGPAGPTGRRQNVTSEYLIKREVRVWGRNGALVLPWHGDNTDPLQDWIDNPATSMDARPPDNWDRLPSYVMDEFLVQVMGHPEIGRVYVAFVMETRKNAYRIRYSAPLSLSEEEYKTIKASSKSFFPYPFTNKDEGWVELVQDPVTKEWKPRPAVP